VAKRGNGEGSIRRRTDGRYEGRYVSGGRQRSVYGKTRKETARKLAEAQRGEASGEYRTCGGHGGYDRAGVLRTV
jgi:hypothetical protein